MQVRVEGDLPAAGAEVEWGEVTAFEPPHRLAYLWHIRRDRADATAMAAARPPWSLWKARWKM